MRADVHRDMSNSTRAFIEVVWPALAPVLGGDSEYLPIEGSAGQELAEHLDMIAGIDGFQIRSDRLFMRGIATRVQWIRQGYKPYDTFSVRVSRPSGGTTERDKRLIAVQFRGHGPLFPDLTIQAYLREKTNELLSVGVVKTVDLFRCVQKHPSGIRRAAGNGGEQFEAYPFEYLRERGYQVKVIRTPAAEQSTGPRLLVNGKDAAA